MVNVREPPNTWRLIELSYQSVFENLALEEALARSYVGTRGSAVIRLWRDPPAVIVGRFQDVDAEADVDMCLQNGIAIARRFTGGGAVFHDLGNLNLTIVTPRPLRDGLREMHERNSTIILDLLERLGVRGVFVPPNSVHVHGRKIAGAAAGLGQHFALWHASILVSTELLRLQRALAPSRGSRQARSIRSNWHPVTTLSELTEGQVTMENVELALLHSCRNILNARIVNSGLLDGEERWSKWLYERKYSLRDWNWNRNWFGGDPERKSAETHTTIAV